MPETFEGLIRRLSIDQDLIRDSEQAIRQGVILPILEKLGWYVYNIREVIPEYPVEEGRVDYCLKIQKNKNVFLEVKRTSEDLDRHEKQLVEYAFKEGIDLAILTNGLTWWFYLTRGKGNWQQRKFFSIDLKEQEPDEVVKHFSDFLSRQAIEDGSALKCAKELQESKEKEEVINNTIPLAWKNILTEPDDLILELLAEKVESLSGYRPNAEDLIAFIRNQYFSIQSNISTIKNNSVKQKNTEAGKVVKKISKRISKPTINLVKVQKDTGEFKVVLNGKTFITNDLKDLYQQVLRYLCDSGIINRFDKYIPFPTSDKRYLISKEPIHQRGNSFVIKVEYKGYFMEAHKDRRNGINHLNHFLNLCDLSVQRVK